MFGEFLEAQLQAFYGFWPGTIYYLVLYFAGGVAATIWPYVRNNSNDLYYSVGASGAVSAVLFATVVWVPEMKLSLIFLPFEFPAYIFAALYLVFEYVMMKSKRSKIAHDAHIGGALFGVFFIFLINIDKAKGLFSLIMN
jgi:membrane associated rhomboid family serine protease